MKHQKDAETISGAIAGWGHGYANLLEIGPGEGMLTQFLSKSTRDGKKLTLVEIDDDLIEGLKMKFESPNTNVINEDFLNVDLSVFGEFGVAGNFPYNISSQIVFRILENRQHVSEMVGMFQKEVAMRIVSKPGNKTYGILSVLTNAYYDREVILHLKPGAFHPPPKVDSTVIRLARKRTNIPDIDNQLFFRVVKTSFGQRRKTLKNSLKSFLGNDVLNEDDQGILRRRPEELGSDEFIHLTKRISQNWQ